MAMERLSEMLRREFCLLLLAAACPATGHAAGEEPDDSPDAGQREREREARRHEHCMHLEDEENALDRRLKSVQDRSERDYLEERLRIVEDEIGEDCMRH